MCVVSMISDYYRDRYPGWGQAVPMPTYPMFPVLPPVDKDKEDRELVEKMRKFMELIEVGKKTDQVIGEPDCERPDTKDFIKQVADRLDAIEKRLAGLENRP